MNRILSIRLLVAVIVAGSALACTPGTPLPETAPPGLGFAWFHDDCAPWDGPALTLYLSSQPPGDVFAPPHPHLRISLYSGLSRIAIGQRILVDVPGDAGHASWCDSAGSCDSATALTIEFTRLETSQIDGALEVIFADRAPVRGRFAASRLPFEPLCG